MLAAVKHSPPSRSGADGRGNKRSSNEQELATCLPDTVEDAVVDTEIKKTKSWPERDDWMRRKKFFRLGNKKLPRELEGTGRASGVF